MPEINAKDENKIEVNTYTSTNLNPFSVHASSKPKHTSRATHGPPEIVSHDVEPPTRAETLESGNQTSAWVRMKASRHEWFRYIKSRQFWTVLCLGQVLSLCLTATNTFTSLLGMEGTSIPAFQTFFNYTLLNIVYTSFTIYKYGLRKWSHLLARDGWRYCILAFFDVQGNYFVVLAYRYTTILSAQLINFWAIVVVMILSLLFLRVRYRVSQYLGILICVGGMGILIASDRISNVNSGAAPNELKGDLFALLGATMYGLSNTFEEFLVSKRPLYEVIGQLGFWGMLINGTQAGIFDRSSFRTANWNANVGGYLTGYTLVLSLFYSLAPILFRLASAAFFNISLLTANFWGVIIGLHVFHLRVHWMYPIAFVLILCGLIVYFLTDSLLGEAEKPWLGENQEGGVSGLGTARRKVESAQVTSSSEASANPALV